MFTDRFITIPIRIYSIKQKELTGNEYEEETEMKINPFDISRYHPSNIDDDDTSLSCTRITFRDGDGVVCYMNMQEFEKLLNGSQK